MVGDITGVEVKGIEVKIINIESLQISSRFDLPFGKWDAEISYALNSFTIKEDLSFADKLINEIEDVLKYYGSNLENSKISNQNGREYQLRLKGISFANVKVLFEIDELAVIENEEKVMENALLDGNNDEVEYNKKGMIISECKIILTSKVDKKTFDAKFDFLTDLKYKIITKISHLFKPYEIFTFHGFENTDLKKLEMFSINKSIELNKATRTFILRNTSFSDRDKIKKLIQEAYKL